MSVKIICIAGARPNFMKIAPIIEAFRAQPGIEPLLVHTGQHYDEKMSDLFFRELGIPQPDMNLEVGSGSHAVQTAEIMKAFEPVCLQHKPDWVLVVGDVNSTIACGLVAVKLGIRLIHVEAGLRSGDRTMPEEINRIVTDSLSDMLLVSEPAGVENLRREGHANGDVHLVGNIMIDTLVINLEKARELAPFSQHGLKEKEYVFITLHRPSNVDDGDSLAAIMQNLVELSQSLPVIFPLHPRTEKNLAQFNLIPDPGRHPNLKLCKPVGYFESIGLADKARFVLTDSGGLQEETTFLKVPCLTLRPNTERPVTITIGTNSLTSIRTLKGDIEHLLNGNRRPGNVPELWDGRTSERIVETLINKYHQ